MLPYIKPPSIPYFGYIKLQYIIMGVCTIWVREIHFFETQGEMTRR